VQDALEWMVLIKEELGNSWLTSNRFRIGASSLLQNISTEIIKTYENKPIQRPLEDSSENQTSEGENKADEDNKVKKVEGDNKDKEDTGDKDKGENKVENKET